MREIFLDAIAANNPRRQFRTAQSTGASGLTGTEAILGAPSHARQTATCRLAACCRGREGPGLCASATRGPGRFAPQKLLGSIAPVNFFPSLPSIQSRVYLSHDSLPISFISQTLSRRVRSTPLHSLLFVPFGKPPICRRRKI